MSAAIAAPVKVIIRRWKYHGPKSLIAIFPEVPGTLDPYTCESYEPIGQHASCDPLLVIRNTEALTDSEMTPLLKELCRIGYKLTVLRRLPANALAKRRAQL